MREQFEKLPEIESSLSEHIWFGSDGLYHSALVNFQGLVGWLNGAWYAYQEQQKKIDALKEMVHLAMIEQLRAEKSVLEWVLK